MGTRDQHRDNHYILLKEETENIMQVIQLQKRRVAMSWKLAPLVISVMPATEQVNERHC